MEKIKRYIETYIPTETCNFRCHYCYITQHRCFNNKLAQFKYSSDFIRKALSKDRLGGTCLFNICAGGETLLSKDIIKIVKELLEEGHYVMIVTNGSLTKRLEEISKFDSHLLKHLMFKFSLHYLELKRLNQLEQFFKNIKMMEDAGSSYVVEITPNDELEANIDEIKEICKKKLGALPHITIGRKDTNQIPPLTKHSFEEYINIWKQFDSEMFNFKTTIFGVKRKEFCYAGDWSIYLNLMTGDIRQCYCGRKIDNVYTNIHKPIKFCAIGYDCGLPHCYNGHAFLTLGDIPNMNTPTYAEIRNRVKKDATEWLTPEMKFFISSKLKESNKEYSNIKKIKVSLRNKPRIFVEKVKRMIYNQKNQ